jgi:hypothetical protein
MIIKEMFYIPILKPELARASYQLMSSGKESRKQYFSVG